ncbi:MAG: DMT family transporter [Myxococcales bacterium]|nr:DMT family transporter [Myxococcales bacterium]
MTAVSVAPLVEVPRVKVHLALVAVQVAFGALPVAGKIAMETVGPYALSLFRVSGAALFFGFLALRGRHASPIPWPDVLRIAGCGLLGMAANQVLFLGGLERTTATNATVLVTTIPVFTFLVAVVSRHERFDPRGALGLLVACAGVLAIVHVERFALASDGLLGDLMIVANALCYACFLVLVRPLATRYGAMRVVAISFVASTIAVAPFGVPQLSDAFARADLRAWLTVLFILAVPTILTYLLNTWALKHARSSTVAVFIYLQPIVGLALAALVLGETLGPRAVAGTLAVFVGVWLVIRRPAVAAT